MIPKESTNDEVKKIDKRKILEALYKCIPESLANEPCKIFEKRSEIEIGRHLYRYFIRENGEIIITEIKVRNDELYTLLLTPKLKKTKKLKLQSQSGVINSGKVQSGVKIMLSFAAAALIIGVGAHYLPKKEKITETNEFSNTYQVTEAFESFEEPKIIIEESQNVEPDVEQLENNVISIPVYVVPTDYLGMQKCIRTKEIYGEYISFYAKRYGLDENILISLFTRERFSENDIVSPTLLEDIGYHIFDQNEVDVAGKMKENIGQLTRAICGEEIVAPIFLEDKVIGYDKIFVLPPAFDSYEISNLKELSESDLFNEEDSQKLKRAYELLQTGEWQIIKRINAFYNVAENINVSTAYLSYLINKKHDLVRGVMSYHAGYGSVPNTVSYEEIFNGAIEAFDPFYVANVLQYANFDNDIFSCTIHYETGEIVTYEFQNTKELGVNYEKNGLSL